MGDRQQPAPTSCCPHCGHRLTTLEAVTALNAEGWEKKMAVYAPDGSVVLVKAGEFNPNTMETA